MGHSTYSDAAYAVRTSTRAAAGIPTFDHDASIKSGAAPAKVHPSLSPRGAAIRESRDSDAHPVTIPIAVVMDTTGSMKAVPGIIQGKLPKLMGTFLDDKASGKRYLGDAYPAIMIGAVDDFDAMGGGRHGVGFHGTAGGEGALQIGQFESGIEIDENLTNLWLTGNGGGTYEESYDLAAYFLARHTAHDAWDKRGKKGYAFFIGDEMTYPSVLPIAVQNVIGDDLKQPIETKAIFAELQERYNVFFIVPAMTNHYGDPRLLKHWQDLLGQQNVLLLDDPEKVCELIASAVAICEEHVGIDDLKSDSIGSAVSDALVPLSLSIKDGSIAKVSAAGLVPIAGDAAEVERL